MSGRPNLRASLEPAKNSDFFGLLLTPSQMGVDDCLAGAEGSSLSRTVRVCAAWCPRAKSAVLGVRDAPIRRQERGTFL